jgi:hypothetical protein
VSSAAGNQLRENFISLATGSQSTEDGIYDTPLGGSRTTALGFFRIFWYQWLQEIPKFIGHSVIIKASCTIHCEFFVFESI